VALDQDLNPTRLAQTPHH